MAVYIKSLDGMRALAILLVMFFHFYHVLEIGWVGVQIFFVLSGYLITNILLKAKQGSSISSYLKRFYWRRTLRIFPVYYAYLIVITGLFFLSGKPENFGIISGYLYTYTYNLYPLFETLEFDAFFTHFWSLSVEEQFYVVWPLLIYKLKNKDIQFLLIALIIIVPIFRFVLGEWAAFHYTEPGEILYRFTFSHFDAFAWGGAIAVFNLSDKLKKTALLLNISMMAMLVVGVVQFLLIQPNGNVSWTSFGYPIGGMLNYQHVWSYIFINVFATALIIYLISPPSSKSITIRIFKHPVLVEIGKLSYGMYVYHWVVLAFHQRYIHPLIEVKFLSFLVYFALVYGVSFLSYHTLEKFFLKMKDTKFSIASH